MGDRGPSRCDTPLPHLKCLRDNNYRFFKVTFGKIIAMLKRKSPILVSYVKITNFDSHGTLNSAQCRAPIFHIPEASLRITTSSLPSLHLVDLLLLVDAVFTGSAVDEQEESSNNRQDLEEVVLGEILVGVVLVKLGTELVNNNNNNNNKIEDLNLQSRSC